MKKVYILWWTFFFAHIAHPYHLRFVCLKIEFPCLSQRYGLLNVATSTCRWQHLSEPWGRRWRSLGSCGALEMSLTICTVRGWVILRWHHRIKHRRLMMMKYFHSLEQQLSFSVQGSWFEFAFGSRPLSYQSLNQVLQRGARIRKRHRKSLQIRALMREMFTLPL